MASFAPFKRHIVAQLLSIIESHRLRPPFLDVGCGQGDVSRVLASKGWAGVAIDASSEAVEASRALLEGLGHVEVRRARLEDLGDERYPTVLMLDVLEHMDDDEAALREAAGLQRTGDGLVLTVPSNPGREWRWDDDFYGHVRRYSPRELSELLSRAGYDTVLVWDLTFPVLWSMRRAYTRMKAPPAIAGSAEERSLASSSKEAWNLGVVSDFLTRCFPWRAALAIQRPFRRWPRLGHELIALAERR